MNAKNSFNSILLQERELNCLVILIHTVSGPVLVCGRYHALPFENAANIQDKKRESQRREEEEIDCNFFSHAKTIMDVDKIMDMLVMLYG